MKLTLPIHLKRPTGKKTYSLNLNQYRNNHFHTNDWLKKEIKRLVSEQLKNNTDKLIPPLTVNYTLFLGNNRKSDLSNWCSVIDKFFLDALVELGYIEDDNTDFVNEINYIFGGIDKNNARVEVYVVGN